MALRKTILNLVLNKGINTGKDPKVLVSELLRLQNGRMDTVGVINKRYGTSVISSYSEQFISKRAERPVLIDDGSLRVFDGSSGGVAGNFDQLDTGVKFSDIEPSSVLSMAQGQLSHVDQCRQTDFTVWSYNELDGVIYYGHVVVVDNATGAIIDEVNVGVGETEPKPIRLAKCGSTTHCWWVQWNSIADYHMYHMTVSSSGVISAATEADASLPHAIQGKNVDVCELDDVNHTMLICYIGSGNTVEAFTWNTGFVDKRTISHVANYLQSCVYKHATGVGMLVFSTASKVYALALDSVCALAGHDGSNNPEEIYTLPATWDCMCATGLSLSATQSRVYLSLAYESGLYRWVNRAVLRDTLTISLSNEIFGAGFSIHVDHASLSSKAFGSVSAPHVLVEIHGLVNSGGTNITVSPAQHIYVLVDDTGRAVGKALPGVAGYSTNEVLTCDTVCSVATSGSAYIVGGLERISSSVFATAAGWPMSSEATGIVRLTVTLGAPSSLRTSEANGLLFIPNSVPYYFDGQSVVEAGFITYPEGLVGSTSTTGTGVLVDGDYGYCATLEWTDAQGNTHRSAPSPPVTITMSSPHNTATINVPVPSAPDAESAGYLSRKYDMRVVLWRTDLDGFIYYRLAAQGLDRACAWSAGGYASFVDHGCSGSAGVEDYSAGDLGPSYTGTGASLLQTSGAAQLYTTGNVAENVQPPSTRIACVHQGRLFIVDREKESTRIVYSRMLASGDAPGINDAFEVVLPDEGGRITALASHQDRLLIFKESSIYCVYGVGLSASGSGQDYSAPLLICQGYGCTNQKSLVALPQGVACMSSGGLILVRPDFTVDAEFGAPVKYHTDNLTISAAALIYELEYAIWTTTTGLAIVFCYGLGQWSTFTNHEATDAVECNGILYRKYSTLVNVENRSTFLDNALSVEMLLVTGWIPISEVEGFGRLYSIVTIGQNIAEHKLYCWPRYDLDPAWTPADAVSFDSSTLGYPFDGDLYYDDDTSLNYLDKAYELTAGTRRQKMKYLQIMIYDESHDGSTPTNEGYSISKIQLVIGIRDPWHRKATAREFS